MTIDRILTHILIFILSFVISASFLVDFLQVSIMSLMIFAYSVSIIYILAFKSYHFSKIDIIFIVILLLGFVSAFLFSNEGLNSYGFIKVFLLSVYLVLFILNKDIILINFYLFIRYLVIIYISVLSIFALSSYFSVVFNTSNFYRLMLTEESSSIILSYYFFLLAIALIYLYAKSKKTTINLITFIGFLFLTIVFGFLTGSRGPLVSFIFSTLAILSLRYLKSKRYGLIIVVLSFILITINVNIERAMYAFLPKTLNTFLDRRYFTERALGSVEERYFLYNKAIEGFVDADFRKKVVGYGSGQFMVYLHSPKDRMYPHNVFLELLFEYGLVVAVIFIYFTIRIMLLFYTRVRDLSIDQLLLHLFFLFVLFRAQFSGDISGNYLIFIFMILILRSNELLYPSKKEVETYKSNFGKKAINRNSIVDFS